MELQTHFECSDSDQPCLTLKMELIQQQEVLQKISWMNSGEQYYLGCSEGLFAGAAETDWMTEEQKLMEAACFVMQHPKAYC